MAIDFAPPMPAMAPDDVSGLGVLARLRRNGLGAFPERCLAQPVVSLRLPRGSLVLIADSGAIVEVLQTRSDAFRRLPAARRILGPIAGRGLLTSEGATWRRQRLAMAPAFTPRQLPMMAGHIVRAAEDMVAALAGAAGGPIDMLAAMQDLSLEIAARSMFSLESGAFRRRLRQLVTAYTSGVGRPAPGDFLFPDWLPSPLGLRRRRFRRRWLALIAPVVAERARADAAEDRDLFDVLVSLHPDDPALLIDQVATMVVAGHETTALALFWSLFLLANAPDWQERVRAEVAGADLSVGRAAGSISRLGVTRAVVDESLRLYPPAFMTARQARTDTRVGDETVRAGGTVLMPFWLLHRDPSRWPDPAIFDPGRFIRQVPGRDRFLPFGLGPHVCIGAQLAMTETVLSLALLVRHFEVRLDDPGRPVLPVATLSTRPDHAPGFRLRPLGRRHDVPAR